MEITFETLSVLMFLIPGFMVTLIRDGLVFSGKRDKAVVLVEALIWSFLIYMVLSGFFSVQPVHLVETKSGEKTSYGIIYSGGAIWLIFATSLAFAALSAWIINNDRLTRVFRFLKITTRSSRGSIWLDVFAVQKRYVIVHLVDGRRVFGWVMNYSNTAKDACIYLYDFAWINDDSNAYIKTDSHGLLFFRKDSIDFIEFTNLDKDRAQEEEINPNVIP